ncbi:hypothetical protein [Archangium sp.]|uniref:hypothetical protein n=1 Tax=Archangium sp. TaxID=1872627 RepID=UPI00389A41C4
MDERLAAVLLALLVCAGPVWAQEAEAPQAPVAAPAEADPAAAAGEDAEADEEAEPEAVQGHMGWAASTGYQEVQTHMESEADGDLRISVGSAVLRPLRGYIPLQVMVHNSGSAPRVVRISIDSNGVGRAELASRQVEVGPRQLLTVWLPVPVAAHGGSVRVQSPGLGFRIFSFYSMDPVGQPVLVLGSEKAFKAGTQLKRVDNGPKLSARFVGLEDAPRELAAYVGHAFVVVAGDVTAIPADAWSALEAYASTGGTLVLLRPPRDVNTRLPLLSGTTSGGVHPYGFGKVRLCGMAEACGAALLADATAMGEPDKAQAGVISPVGPPPSWQRHSYMLNDGEQPLLPGVQAPVGRFLLLITLFVLAVGPGGLALARRKGPVALLIAVPSVALVTCLAIVVWSVLVDGFSVHASRYSLTWLDRPRDRALTVGISGYYANLEPDGIHVPALAALLGPDVDWDAQAVEADWSNGMAVTGGFLPSRTYREWGELAVVPTRARLVVRREGKEWRVQNALGAPLAEGYVRLGGKVWELPALADGAEAALTSGSDSTSRKTAPQLASFFGAPERRFKNVSWSELDKPLQEGGFLARVEGPGMLPTAVLPVELHQGLHLVRGRVDGP